MAIHTEVGKRLDSLNTTYTVSGAVGTITGNLSHRQLEDLMDAAYNTNHQVTVVAGVPKVSPR